MKYKNFDDFFSSIDINKNEMIDNWENLKKRKKKIYLYQRYIQIQKESEKEDANKRKLPNGEKLTE